MSSKQQIWTSSAGALQRKPYGNGESMSAIIAPPGASSVTLRFTSLDTEKCCDFVTIKSCTAANCLQSSNLGKYSGSTIPSQVTSDTGILLIQWESDCRRVYSGWSVSWSANWRSLVSGGKPICRHHFANTDFKRPTGLHQCTSPSQHNIVSR
jgi:hypothetical protein